MFKIIWLLKRKAGVSFEQFRDHYENSHSVLGRKYFGHLMLGYRRNYNLAHQAGGHAAAVGMRLSEYDCIAEWELRDEEAFGEFKRIFADKEISRIFLDDEEHFLDSQSTRLVICDTQDTGTAD